MLYLVVAWILLTVFPAWGEETPSSVSKADIIEAEALPKNWWKDKRRGWYWKEDPQEKQEKQEEPEYVPVLKRYTYNDLWNMHPDDYAKLMKESLHRAIQTLSVDDVKEYLILQNIAARKARAYAAVADFVTTTDPTLNMTKDFPITYGGRVAYLKEVNKDKVDYINQRSQNHALLYFKKEGCPYCAVMDRVLKMFTSRYQGWIVKHVDVTFRPDLAERFNVTITPTVILVQRGSNEWMPVTYGAVSLEELEELLYRALRFVNKEITPEQWWLMRHQKGGSFDPLIYIDHLGGGK